MQSIKCYINFLRNWGVIIFTLLMLLSILILKIHWIGFELKYHQNLDDITDKTTQFENKFEGFLHEDKRISKTVLAEAWHEYILSRSEQMDTQALLLEKEKLLLIDVVFIVVILSTLFILWLEVFNKIKHLRSTVNHRDVTIPQASGNDMEEDVKMLLDAVQSDIFDPTLFVSPMMRAVVEKIALKIEHYQSFIDKVDDQIDALCEQVESHLECNNNHFESQDFFEENPSDDTIKTLQTLTEELKNLSKDIMLESVSFDAQTLLSQSEDFSNETETSAVQEMMVQMDDKIQQLHDLSYALNSVSTNKSTAEEKVEMRAQDLQRLKAALLKIKQSFNELYV